MNNVVDIASKLEERAAECRPCVGCGESGTWGPTGMCLQCRGEVRAAMDEHQQAEDLELIQADRKATLLGCRVPSRQARIGFDEPDVWPADPQRPDLALDTWHGDPWAVTLTGLTGTGKTTLAVELLYRHRCQGGLGRFVRASKIPQFYFTQDGRAAELLEAVDLLVLDDLGRGHLGNAWQAVGELLAVRYDEELPTIVTTNLSLDEIAGFDSHAADRLFEGLVIAVKGDSRRELR